jgi:hypothetical protein
VSDGIQGEPLTETDLRTLDAAQAAALDLAHNLRLARENQMAGALKPAFGALKRLAILVGSLDEIATRCTGSNPLNGDIAGREA